MESGKIGKLSVDSAGKEVGGPLDRLGVCPGKLVKGGLGGQRAQQWHMIIRHQFANNLCHSYLYKTRSYMHDIIRFIMDRHS